jgi:hypothetical protein
MFKFLSGVLVGGVITVLLLLSFLPGAPSNSISKYPIAKTHLPSEAVKALKPDVLGLDIYWNTREPPVLTKNMNIPLEKSTSYRISTRDDGTFVIKEALNKSYFMP